jgi:hypothetical protein
MKEQELKKWFDETLDLINKLSNKLPKTTDDRRHLKIARKSILTKSSKAYRSGVTLPSAYGEYVANCFQQYFNSEDKSELSLKKAFHIDGREVNQDQCFLVRLITKKYAEGYRTCQEDYKGENFNKPFKVPAFDKEHHTLNTYVALAREYGYYEASRYPEVLFTQTRLEIFIKEILSCEDSSANNKFNEFNLAAFLEEYIVIVKK